MDSAEPNRTRRLLPDLLLIGGIGIPLILFQILLRDVPLCDELIYLTSPSVSTEWGPLYALWYKIILFILPDRVTALYFNHLALALLFAGALYTFTYYLSLPAEYGFLIAIAAILTGIIAVDIRVGLLAMIVLILTFIAVVRLRSVHAKWFAAAAGVLITAYIRPEFWLTFLLLAVILLVVLWRASRTPILHRIGYALGLGGLFVVGALSFGIIEIESKRSWVAFGQHFAANAVIWSGSNLDPWTDWRQITQQTFGNADSIGTAAINNPRALIAHVAVNSFFMPLYLLRLLITPALLIAIGGVLASWGISNVVIGRPRLRPTAMTSWLKQRWYEGRSSCAANYIAMICIFLCALPVTIAAIVIWPSVRHLSFILTLMSLALLIVWQPALARLPATTTTRAILWSAIGLAGLWLGGFYLYQQARPNQPNLNTIRAIQSLDIEQDINALPACALTQMAGANVREIAVDPTQSLPHVLRDQAVQLVITGDSRIDNRHPYRNDPVWPDFIANPERYGFVRIPIPHTTRNLLVAKTLLE